MAYYVYVSSGQTTTGIRLKDISMYVYDGGTANSTTVNLGGILFVESGGTANSTTVNEYGYLNVRSGGVANSTTVNSSGRMDVYSGGTANNTTVNSWGYLYAEIGGTANSTTVNSGGYLVVYRGGIANSTTVNPGGKLYISSGGTANSTTVNDEGKLYVRSGGTANSTTVNSSGWMYVSSGGTANSTTVNSSGWMYVEIGGTANSTTVNDEGKLLVSSGGTATNITENGGYVSVGEGANVTFTQNTINGLYLRGRFATLHSGTIANSTTVNDWGYLYVYSGGTANNTTVNSSGRLVESGGTANNTTVNSSGGMYVYSGGTANNTTVNSWGYLYVESGGTANSTTVNSGGKLYVYCGGTATIAYNPWQGGIYSSTGAFVTYQDRDKNIYIGHHFSGLLSKTDVLDNFSVSSGVSALIYSGGTANNTTVNHGGNLYVSSGGTANSTTVKSGGTLQIFSEGKVTGLLQIENGATVSAYAGSIIDFNIADRTTEDDYLINNLSLIKGTPTYTITVSNNQEYGYYKLAQGASNFSGSITIVNNSESFGSLTLNSSEVKWNGIRYSLLLENNNLILCAKDGIPPVKPTATANITSATNQNVTVTATFSNDSVKKEYSLNNSAWQTYTAGIVMTSNGNVYFRGIDAAGNISDITTYTVSNIDKIAPVKPTATANITSTTNQNVTVTATFSNDSVKKEYSLNNSTWQSYTTGIVMTSNGTVYFRGTDQAGNISEITSYRVSNIDKIAPVKPTATANITSATNQNVTVSAVFSNDSVKKEYSLNNRTWQNYTSGIVMTSNGNIYFRGTDEAGNISAVTTYTVSNIDKVAPDLNISGNLTDFTSFTVLTATVSDSGSGPKSVEYSFNNIDWNIYTSPVRITSNGNIFFRATDHAGNIATTSRSISNIIKAVNYYSNGKLISSANTMSNKIINSGFELEILTGGVVTSTVVNNGGIVSVDGGVATSTTVNSSGGMYVNDGGTANSTTVNSSGGMYVNDGGTANNTVLSRGGLMTVLENGNVSGVIICSAAFLDLQSGAYGEHVSICRYGSLSVAEGNQIRDLHILSRGDVVMTNVSAYDVKIYSSGLLTCSNTTDNTMFVSGAEILSNGKIVMSSGAEIHSAAVFKAGTLQLENGGSSYNTLIREEGRFTMLGVAEDTILHGGSMYVGDSAYQHYDGTGGNPTSNIYEEDIHASKNTLNSSWLHIYSGGTATSNVVNSNSWLHVYHGGTATSNVINSSGYLTVQDSGTADTTLLHSGGYMRLYTGAILKGESLVGGKVTVETAGTSATEDVVRAYGAKINYLVSERTTEDLSIITDLGMIMGATYFITISENQETGKYRLADGAEDFDGSITVRVEDGTELREVRVGGSASLNEYSYKLYNEEGTLYFDLLSTPDSEEPDLVNYYSGTKLVSAAEIMSGKILNRNWKMHISSGGVVNNTSVNSGGILHISSGGKHTGSLKIENGAVVSAFAGSVIDFNIADRTTEDDYLINNLSLISGTPAYTITVSDNQQYGSYKLAQGAEGFTQNITLLCNSESLGTISISSMFRDNENTYRLNLENGNLFLVIEETDNIPPVKPTATANITSVTNQNVTVTATFSNDSVKKEYSLDNSTWQTYTAGIVMSSNGNVYFRGTDEAGNISDITTYTVSNIDKVAPALNITENLAEDAKKVVLSATASDSGSGIKSIKYSFDQENWREYTSALEITENKTVYFKATDIVGNVTTQTFEVDSIYTPTVSLVNYYSGTTLISGAEMMSGTNVSANETLHISSGGVAENTTVNKWGAVHISNGGLASDSVISSGGNIHISSGGTAKLTNIYNGGGLHVFSGAAASGTTVYQGGYFGVGDGARTYDTTIELFGALTVWSGGIVTGNTVNSKGSLILSSGAVADQSVINGGGGLHVFSGAVASNTTVEQNGFFGVGLGATTYNTTIGYAGSLTVWGGGVVHVNEINQWGAIILSSGAVANSTTINPGGGLNIFKGAAAYTTTITSSAFLGIGGGGTLYSGDLENTATMAFYNGSILRGWVNAEGTILTSGTVDAKGTYINFELGERSADQNVILDNITNLNNVQRYSVEVETDQETGTYALAGGAENFDGRVTLYVGDGNDRGILSVGSCLDYNDRQYCLQNKNGILSLKIA